MLEELGIVIAKAMKMYFYHARLFVQVQTLAVSGFLLLVSGSANAAIWYVDNTASGSNNGTSWANAWTSPSQVSGISAGDTVYISGGPNGSSQNYNISNWSPVGGNSSGRITYQIGQDSLHNGTANFIIAPNAYYFVANNPPPSYINIIGNAGDGKEHFSVSNCVLILQSDGTFTDMRLGYINFGTMTGNKNSLNIGTVNNFEFDHNYIYQTYSELDGVICIGAVNGTNGYDQTLIHDNVIFSPTSGGVDPGFGADCFQMFWMGTGYSIYNNICISYYSPTWDITEGQHSDGYQTAGGTYIKIYNNYFYGYTDVGIYGGCWGNAVSGAPHTFSHVRIYNNIVDCAGVNDAGGIDISSDEGSGSTYSDCQVINNLVHYPTGDQNNAYDFATGDGLGTWSGISCSNNITIGKGGIQVQGGTTVVSLGNNPVFTEAQAASLFQNYISSVVNNPAIGTNINWHLVSTATSLIGKGANFYSVFTTDKDGNARPSSGPWDIGPYEYTTNSGVIPVPLAPSQLKILQ